MRQLFFGQLIECGTAQSFSFFRPSSRLLVVTERCLSGFELRRQPEALKLEHLCGLALAWSLFYSTKASSSFHGQRTRHQRSAGRGARKRLVSHLIAGFCVLAYRKRAFYSAGRSGAGELRPLVYKSGISEIVVRVARPGLGLHLLHCLSHAVREKQDIVANLIIFSRKK